MENTTEKSISRNLLESKWILWYHSPLDKSWGRDSYKSIIELESIEDYLLLERSWIECLPTVVEGMYFVMRKNKDDSIIYPQWEDLYNINGGYWSFKVENLDAQKIWFVLFKLLLGESILINEQNPYLINGISISPKRTFCIIKVWNKDKDINDVKFLSDVLSNYLDIENVKYSSHNVNIERDAEKMIKFKEREDNPNIEDLKKRRRRNLRHGLNNF